MAKTEKKTKGKVSISKMNRQITIGFVLVTVILLLIIAYFSLSRASILLTPEQYPIEHEMTMEVLPDVTSTLTSSNILPGKIEITEEKAKEIFLPSEEKLVNVKSTGQVTIINNYTKSQTLVETTRLLSEDGLLFRTTETVIVPAGGQIKVAVEADQEGEQYAIPAGKFTIPGLWEGIQDKIYGESERPMSAASYKQKIVTVKDLEKAKDILLKLIKKRIVESLDDNDMYVLVDTEVISTESDTEAGSIADQFTFTLEAKVVKISFTKNDIYSVAENNLKISVPDNQTYLSYNPDSITITLDKYDINGQAATVSVSISGLATANIDQVVNKQDILGFAKQDVERHFLEKEGIKTVQVDFTPSWVKSVPPLEDHVEITIIK